MKTILFVCLHNSGRSQMAEFFFNRMAGGKAHGISAGTQPGIDINPTVREAMLEVGIYMNGQKPKMLTQGLVDQAERIISMGCGVDEDCPVNFVPAEDWGLDDPAGQSLVEVRLIRDQVKSKVERLIKELSIKGESMKKKYLFVALMCVLVLSLVPLMTACGDDNKDDAGSTSSIGSTLSGSINIIGSNTVTPISTLWAEAFMDDNSKVNISVSGPGSGVGIAQLINGTTDICQASRAMKSSEIEDAKSNGVMANEIRVATDALAVVVHPDNPVSELTIAQISGIYTGKITNWKEVGGNDESIVALSRDTSSGTHVFFKEHVVQMAGLPTNDTSLEYGSKVLSLPSTEQGVMEVSKNKKAIFYPGLGYVTDKVKPLGIKQTADDPAVLPSLETALDNSYPISRPLFFYTDGEPTGVIKAFIDFCISSAGQEFVLEAGYVPLS